jgi:dTDP-glucose 4,6-dehydratase
LRRVLEAGVPGQVYNIGGGSEMPNMAVVRTLCDMLDRRAPRAQGHAARIAYVGDRPGHDRRYAIDGGKIARELGWRPAESFASGIEKTVGWYLAHQDWVAKVQSGEYRHWIERNYGRRGVAP